MLTGLNHITISTTDLERSFTFYVEILGMTPHARWARGAYLTVGELWFCLSLGEASPSQDYSHIAFDIKAEDYANLERRLLNYGVKIWKTNKSEGESLYFLDPDDHKLELHVGSLTSRLKELKNHPYEGLTLYS